MTALALAIAALLLVAPVLGVVWATAPQPQHAGAGALTVAQLLAQSREQDRTERLPMIPPDLPDASIAWPTTDPDAPTGTWAPVDLPTLRRVLDGLHNL
ncbi:hypothetical protein [Haloactinomyces albus]|uniref:Uncharacterized protein n=1 Tax=Haloactinomyces albus TaxID=1352928 RepID=A0AAE3ZDW2_9ACTN|nr:hypothetical protein [Haloactinomyces albus]MDR7301417.1 hypothetical protein [Haloactinomyces albus]MDR7302807.1 hypothetical protein [Haloactinomyces albus]